MLHHYNSGKTTIIIIDDHKLVRETWTMLLNEHPRFKVVAECSSGEEGLDKVVMLQPDMMILDINLPGMNGMDTVKEILRVAPRTRILGVSLYTQPSYATTMMRNGALGYITKTSSRQELFTALEEVSEGRRYICEEIKEIQNSRMASDDEQTIFNRLSRRELEVISLVKEGKSSRETAEVLHLSPKTVEVHRYNILKKLGLRNTAELVNVANKLQAQ
jgi:DNA-binding NarL/FixJ family response regulator